MTLLRQLCALLLLALWLPATQHCALAAAGIPAGHDCPASPESHEHPCPAGCACSLHGVADSKAGLDFVLALAKNPARPASFLPPPLRELSLRALASMPAMDFPVWEHPPAWLSCWRFLRRSAFPARAPSTED